ncbi:hypothetical protein A343_2248 [Porphyromonas gingivalis JCVI SC001]|nr:hypothetical protein A343_2248 [Porphyromonas gingivalis JCVI SC001]
MGCVVKYSNMSPVYISRLPVIPAYPVNLSILSIPFSYYLSLQNYTSGISFAIANSGYFHSPESLFLRVCRFVSNRQITVNFLFQSVFLLLFVPLQAHRQKVAGDKNAARCSSLLQLHYLTYPLFRMDVECPIYFFIGQGAVDVPSHYESAILQDFLPCFLSALGKHFKHTFKDILCPYSVNSFLHILKIQPLIICLASAHHWTVCDG